MICSKSSVSSLLSGEFPSFSQLYEQIDANCPSDFTPLLYCRYVDDTLCIFETNSQAQCFLQYLHCQQLNISFTHESEDSNSLPFLDVMVTHPDNTFSTTLYRKKRLLGYILTLIVCRLYNTRSILYLSLFIELIIFAPRISFFMNKVVVVSVFLNRINFPSILLIG